MPPPGGQRTGAGVGPGGSWPVTTDTGPARAHGCSGAQLVRSWDKGTGPLYLPVPVGQDCRGKEVPGTTLSGPGDSPRGPGAQAQGCGSWRPGPLVLAGRWPWQQGMPARSAQGASAVQPTPGSRTEPTHGPTVCPLLIRASLPGATASNASCSPGCGPVRNHEAPGIRERCTVMAEMVMTTPQVPELRHGSSRDGGRTGGKKTRTRRHRQTSSRSREWGPGPPLSHNPRVLPLGLQMLLQPTWPSWSPAPRPEGPPPLPPPPPPAGSLPSLPHSQCPAFLLPHTPRHGPRSNSPEEEPCHHGGSAGPVWETLAALPC